MVGPSIMLAGLALGSGEFILWPRIAYASGFVFFWAALLGMITQFFVNMEIERWTLATGESALAGFSRLSWHWSWIFLILNIVPWAWPGWGTGAAQMGSWLIFGPVESIADGHTNYGAYYVQPLAIALLLLCGVVLTSGPVVYNTVERMQTFLVGLILVLVAIIAVATVRWDAFAALFNQLWRVGGLPDPIATGLPMVDLLGAVAFAGAGGSLNLGQSNYIMDKGYAMGQYIGRITSPLTGKEEPIPETGFHFRHTPENMARWQGWWRAANIEHFFSFLMTCIVTLFLLSLITYSPAVRRTRPAARIGEEPRRGHELRLGAGPDARRTPVRCFSENGVPVSGRGDSLHDGTWRARCRFAHLRRHCEDKFPKDQRALEHRPVVLRVPVGGDRPRFDDLDSVHERASAAVAHRRRHERGGDVPVLADAAVHEQQNPVAPALDEPAAVRDGRVVVWSCGFYGYFTIQAVRLSLLPLLFGK